MEQLGYSLQNAQMIKKNSARFESKVIAIASVVSFRSLLRFNKYFSFLLIRIN